MKKLVMTAHSVVAMRMLLLAAGCVAIISTNFSFQNMPVSVVVEQLAIRPNAHARKLQSNTKDMIGNSSVVLSRKRYTYYYPQHLANSTTYSSKKPMFMVTGILSAMKNKVERNLIRPKDCRPQTIFTLDLLVVAPSIFPDCWTKLLYSTESLAKSKS